MLKGALLNSLFVVIGTLVGLLLKKNIKDNMQDIIIKALALVVLYLAINSMVVSASAFNVLLSMVIGAFIGEIIDLDGKLIKLGDWLQEKFAKGDSSFSAGFVQASLLFCVGSMAILGALQSGLQNDHTTLITKGIIDGITAIFFAAKNGIGVMFSSVILLIYQGGMTLASSLLKPILTTECMNQIEVVGGIILLTVSLNMLNIAKFKSMNYVVAIVITVILTLFGI